MTTNATATKDDKKISSMLRKEGYEGVKLFEKIASRTVALKEQSRSNRCSRCWHDTVQSCICSYLAQFHPKSIKLSSIKVLVLMHYKEYLSAGNDAKLILAMLPTCQTELFVFGREGDWERFEAECSLDPAHTFTLWPADDALTVEEFVLSQLPSDSPWRQQRHDGTATGDELQQQRECTRTTLPTLRVILLDGVYSQARSMFRAMKRRFPQQCFPPYVCLHPKTLSVYHRAQKSYAQSSAATVKKSKDPKALHICTVEAFALLMKELGEYDDTTEKLVAAVELNNKALQYNPDVRPPPLSSPSTL